MSFDSIDKWQQGFLTQVDQPREQFIFSVCGNKCDVVEGDESQRKVDEKLVKGWLQQTGQNNVSYKETSAMNGNRVAELFQEIAEEAVRREKARQGEGDDPLYKHEITPPMPPPAEGRGCAC
jgi:predicted GTPase